MAKEDWGPTGGKEQVEGKLGRRANAEATQYFPAYAPGQRVIWVKTLAEAEWGERRARVRVTREIKGVKSKR